MPVGVIVDALTVIIGGVIGVRIGSKMPKRISDALTEIFGIAAFFMGITLIVQMKSLSAIIIAMILGTLVGEYFRLEDGLMNGVRKVEGRLSFIHLEEDKVPLLISTVVLFCFSGTGIFGALNSGMTGDHSILIAKSVLDFFTAIIFGSMIGYIIALIAVPQFAIGAVLFYLAGIILPFTNAVMISDFKACGGLITFAVGLKISGLKQYRVINMLPALLLVMPISYLWNLIF